MRIFIIIILFCIQSVKAQEVRGIIYDSDKRVSDFVVINLNDAIYSTTNQEGYFTISTDLEDTLVFNSIQFDKQILIVEQRHLQEPIVIELKKTVNPLDQVNISSSTREFNVKKANNELKKEIITDIERNWFIYYPPNPKGNLFDGFVSVINKLFPKKPKIRIIELNDYQELFTSDETLNFEYLKKSLGIPENHYYLFLDYLESKSLNYELLDKSRRLDLIQKINHISEEYIIMLRSNE